VNSNHHTETQKLRESLTAEIVADLEYEIGDLFASAPDGLTNQDRNNIHDELIAQAKLVTNALTTEELQNEGARRAYTCGAVATVRQMINLRMAQVKKV
jgi:hypothetical protein